MKEEIQGLLQPVKARQQNAFLLRMTVIGLCVSGGIGLILAAFDWILQTRSAFRAGDAVQIYLGWNVPSVWILSILAAGPVVGLLVGLLVRRSWHEAAQAVDTHYQLKDRSVTALAFLDQSASSELHSLQISDAAEHLKNVEPKVVVPLKMPRALPVGLFALVLAIAGLFWSLNVREVEAAVAPAPEHILAVADNRLQTLEALQENIE